MSKLVKLFAALALIISVIAIAPGGAEARWGGGWHGGWHGGGWNGGWHRGWGGGWGGWGWGPAFGWGWGPAWGGGPGWGNPYFYSAGPRCGWVRVRAWRNGYWVPRRAWRCW